ncbi:MAG: TonB-dependent receptor [Polymorphobacter sp.]|uniref:TonB-dependent receptor n=1 Tax=Polymorphobacter sp. TaxID=1909290 RepID=UPI003A8B3384
MSGFSNRVLILAGASLLATAAGAQEVAQGEEGMDDLIIVTASKRAATLQDTPISVSVSSKAQIEQAQIRDALDLQTLVPSLRVAQLQSSANTNFIIRGFGNGANNAGIEPSVGVFIDGVYRSRSAAQIGDLPNLERIEVLRGPQSTLFGKNASAGIISIVTAEPQFEWGGGAEFSYGNLNAIVARADITGPISETVAVSLAGNLNKRDGFIQDDGANFQTNERDRWGVRAQLLFKPSETFKARFIADYDKIDEICCGVGNIVDGPTGNAVRALGGQIDSNNPLSYRVFTNFPSTNEIENYGVSLQTDAALGVFDLTTIFSYRAVRTDTNADSDFTSADLIGRNRGANEIDTYTAEVRLASNYDGPFNFLIGGFYFHEDIKATNDFQYGADFRNYVNLLTDGAFLDVEALLGPAGIPAGTFGAQGLGVSEAFDYRNRAISLFGQFDYELTDRLTLTAGFNYTRDRKDVLGDANSTDVFSGLDFVAIGAGLLAQGGVPPALIPTLAQDPAFNPLLALQPLQFLPPFLGFPNSVEDGRTRDNDLSYTLRAAYKFSDNISGYVTYATGFKASSWNLSRDSRPTPNDFIPGSPVTNPPPSAIRDAGLAVPNFSTGSRFAGPEDAEVYEIGLKGQFDTFAFNLAIFEQSLRGFQGNVFTGTGFILGNAEKQSTKGIELDTSFTPIRDLNITASFTYLDPIYDSFVGGSAINPATLTVVPTDLSGRRPAGIPEFAIAVGSTYTQRLGGDTRLIWHVDYSQESPTQIADGLPQFRRSFETLNASLTLALGNGLEVTAWGRNLTQPQFISTLFPSVAQAGSLSGYPSGPRTYGGLVRYRF